jgi:hypothetical protein
MQDLQHLKDSPSALARAVTYLLVPIAVVALLPLLLLFVLILYLLALVHGARIFVFSVGVKQPEPEPKRPHFIDVPAAPQALADESQPAPKG